MDHGFKPEHFSLLKKWGGLPRNSGDAESDKAYQDLWGAYDATAKWANLLQSRYFPRGRCEIVRRPTFQWGNKFKRYTWARIYPTPKSPKKLAYTVGIDAVGEFCVKIDTVDAGRSKLRKEYEQLRGPDYQTSAIGSVIAPHQGLAMSLEGLVEWSAQQIASFGMGYSEVATALGLISPALEIVSDAEQTKSMFEKWSNCLLQNSEQYQSMFWLREGNIFFRRHTPIAANIGTEFGLDPRGESWAVQINEPSVAGDHSSLSAIAVDETGARFLLRQGRLQPNSRRTVEVKGADFVRMTGLTPVEVEGKHKGREWFIVAALDEPDDAIRRRTAGFVERCWAVYVPAGTTTGRSFPYSTTSTSATESGGKYVIPAKEATAEQLITRRHGEVWLALTSILSENQIDYWKGRLQAGFEIDLEITPTKSLSLLIEIKTTSSPNDIYTGLGQLQLYRRLFPQLKNHQPILLLPEGIKPQLRQPIIDCGIELHTYGPSKSIDGKNVTFSKKFLATCGVIP